MDNQKILDISWRTIFKIALVVVCFYIIYAIKDILVWFLFAVITSILFDPAIDFLQKKKVPRILGILLTYFSVFGIFTILIYLSIPLFSHEIQQFLQSFPEYFSKIAPPFQGLGLHAFENTESFLKAIGSSLSAMANSIFAVLFAIFGGFFSTLFVITTAIFISLGERSVEKTLVYVFPPKYETYILNLWKKCQKKVTGWFGARLLTCLFVGIATFISLLIFKSDYPFTLALFAGVFNFIPYVGPILSGVLLFLVVSPVNITKGIFVVLVFILIQAIENHILSPILMKKFVGMPPVLVLISLVIGGKIWGFLGAILIIPIAGILFEFAKEFLQKRRDKKVIVVQSQS